MRATVCLPTYNELENLERDGRRARGGAARRATACSSSTTPRPTAPASSPIGSPQTRPVPRRPPPRAQGGARARLHRRLPPCARRRRRARARDGLRLLARPAGRSAPDRGGRGRRRPRARLALRPGRRDPQLGRGAPRGLARRATSTRRSCSAAAFATSPAASSASAASCSRRSTSTRATREATPSRSRRPTASRRAGFTIREVPISFSDRERGHSKMSRAIVAEAAWKVPLLRAACAARAPVTWTRMREVTDASFEAGRPARERARSSSTSGRPGAGPAARSTPVLEQLERETEALAFVKLDIDENPRERIALRRALDPDRDPVRGRRARRDARRRAARRDFRRAFEPYL